MGTRGRVPWLAIKGSQARPVVITAYWGDHHSSHLGGNSPAHAAKSIQATMGTLMPTASQ
jgi:hypothetical protein